MCPQVFSHGHLSLFSYANVLCSLGEGAPQGWRTPYVLVLLILGILLVIVFIIWEFYYEYPLIPMSIWKDHNLSIVRG